MNVWFGTSWHAPINTALAHVDVPVGAACLWCDENITATDSGWGQSAAGPWMHVECFGRQLVGSVGHQLRICSCYGGPYEDSPELSRRDAARAAWDLALRR